MPKKYQGMNKFQRAAHRKGEERVSREEMEELLELSHSEDIDDRFLAASYLCSCHIRHPDKRVLEALYRMMEDPEVQVRRAAWHTLEDGGCPTDATFEVLLKRRLEKEKDKRVLGLVKGFAKPFLEKERVTLKMAARVEKKVRGKCDFCGETDVPIVNDLDTMIPTVGMPRAALICDTCVKVGS